MEFSETLNADYIDEQYRRWKSDPAAVSRDWRYFFEGFELAAAEAPGATSICDEEQALRQARVDRLIYRYRDIGHLLSCMDPLAACPTEHPFLALAAVGLSPGDLDREFFTSGVGQEKRSTLKEIVRILKETYCRSVGVEYMHIQDPDERKWLRERMEPGRNRPDLDGADRSRIFRKLTEAALFEQFLNKKFLAVTRFSLEGADAVIPMLDFFCSHVAENGCREIILGMAHRGRLNVQAHILGKPYEEILGEFESCYDPENLVGAGDVKYHQGYLADVETVSGKPLRLFLVNNPSHLEAVDPVAEGVARARQEILSDGDRHQVVPILVHGDAAFAGQGVVTETLNMSQLAGYRTGGTVHLVINNQIGYTTVPEDARSTRYATDVAKMLMVPVFHIHGENPESAVHVARLAADYRTTFGKDVVIDLVCYRRYGHNEGDEPYFTQPRMYDRIRERPSLHRIYGETLVASGEADARQIEEMERSVTGALETAYETVHGSACPFPETAYFENWDGFHGRFPDTPPETGVDRKRLQALSRSLNTLPDGFTLHPKLKLLLKKRRDAVMDGSGIDWANAESLAFATLVTEGEPVRLSGQDCRRGTFSQRHSSLVDTGTGESLIPLNGLAPDQAPFSVYNSHLAEYGVLGFEYGYAIAQPRGLVLWEAQFGDFVNNAQSVIDLFIASGESKWRRLCGLALLLPHGWEGMGPEHSSARLERFLQLCAEDNLMVTYPTTPAQYFHLLRRQAKWRVRKPLVVLTPKSLLRHPLAVSRIDDLTAGGFMPVIDDEKPIKTPRRVIFCSGKIYYELLQRREALGGKVALIRIEEFYPFPEDLLGKIVQKYKGAASWCWVQEEPENMGGWQFVRPRLDALVGKPVRYIGRAAASSPATGFPVIYREQQGAIVDEAVGKAKKA